MKMPSRYSLFIKVSGLIAFALILFANIRTHEARAANPSLTGTTVSESRATHISRPSLETEFNRFKNDAALAHASWSFLLIDLETNQQLLAYDHQRALSPASVLKLVTTASALILLGPDFRFSTKLMHDGRIDEQGTLHGNLYIKGSGDPSLGTAFWADSLSIDRVLGSWFAAMQSAGIKQVNGHIIADEDVFDANMIPGKWLWEDIGNYFGAGSGGLTVNENAYTVNFDAGNILGAPAHIRSVVPEIAGMSLINEVTTGPSGSGDRVYIYGAPEQNERLLTGTVPLGALNFAVRGSMADPAAFLAHAFASYIDRYGIITKGQPTTMRALSRLRIETTDSGDNQRKEIAAWISPPLSSIIYRTNMASVNVYTENLLKRMALEQYDQGSYDGGIQVVTSLWADRGMETSGMKLYDGSGLAPSNRVTAEQIGFVLSYMWRHESFTYFNESLPVAGRSGSLMNFFRGNSSEDMLRAKSGFLSQVRSYAGYTTTRSGKEVAFVLIVNDYEGSPANMRTKMFRLLEAISSATDL